MKAGCVMPKMGSTDACRKLLTDFATVKEHKALAVPVAGSGVGYSANRDTTANAFVAALYACNHVKDRPARLCETHNVNGFDVREVYALGLASHVDGLAKLVSPAEKFYANEEYGGGMTSANGLRSATLSFTNNDTDESPFDFSIQGTGSSSATPRSASSWAITRLT